MLLLGKLGIDPKLLIAQIINFGLLLWLLAKFLYRPIIKRIEADEKTLQQAKIEKENLEKSKELFEKQQKIATKKAKAMAQEAIKEAEQISKEIKQKAYEENQKSQSIITQRTKKISKLERSKIEKAIFDKLQLKVKQGLKQGLQAELSDSLQKQIHNTFFLDLISRLEKLKIESSEKMFSQKGFNLEELKKSFSEEKTDSTELEKLLGQKMGSIILEYAFPLDKEQETKIKNIISKKIGIDIPISKKLNKNLINGFRLEIEGRVIESNLLNIINNAIKN